jgi:hypothetical protein
MLAEYGRLARLGRDAQPSHLSRGCGGWILSRVEQQSNPLSLSSLIEKTITRQGSGARPPRSIADFDWERRQILADMRWSRTRPAKKNTLPSTDQPVALSPEDHPSRNRAGDGASVAKNRNKRVNTL